jgi:hypothetical protein
MGEVRTLPPRADGTSLKWTVFVALLRTSQNLLGTKFAELPFHALG